MNQPNPIVDKIKKLLALANDAGATEQERESALRMAHGLLVKHNLEMADVHASVTSEDREDYVNATYGMTWCRNLSASIAKLFFCKYYFGRKINGTKMEHHFVGKASNVATAALMAEYAIMSILKEARSRGWHNLSPEARSFAYGAANRIWERVQAMMKNPEVEGATGTSLVVANVYQSELEANDLFLKEAGTKLISKPQRSSPVDLRAYGAGKEFGNKVGLDIQVGSAKMKVLR